LGHQLPDADSEREDPPSADLAYEDACRSLRARTRDRKRFKLLFEENVDYGFRRNSLGIRPFALGISAAATTASLVLVGVEHDAWGRWAICAGVSAMCGLYWLIFVRPEWVRDAANAYADRLVEALDVLAER
jgi:hypothetical protein